MITDFIYVNKTSICKQLCDDIISMFEAEEEGKYEGVTFGGLNKDVKTTTDFLIPKENTKNANEESKQKWRRVNSFLEKEIARNTTIYIQNLQKKVDGEEQNSSRRFQILSTNFLTTGEFMIQKYDNGKGRYIYHNDSKVDWPQKRHRVLTYIFYLNDVDEGGETEFWKNFRVKPEAGKLVLFPASWLYPHCGRIPYSSDKYIITGWLYQHE